MTAFDWILLTASIPMFLANGIGFMVASRNPLVLAGVATPKVSPTKVLFWFCCIMLVVYRVWG